ncbi:MAG: hypothetical protein K2X91_17835, partial [Thermoleophilia bacterium]|nr:hypothetical protein [Thermoleophilia bacterium]
MSITRAAGSQIRVRTAATFYNPARLPQHRFAFGQADGWHGRCNGSRMATTKTKKVKAPWERPNPKGRRHSKALDADQKSTAKASAARAGRRYPNL